MAGPSAAMTPSAGRDYVAFEDPDEDRTWLFDCSFLASNWRCLFGDGCQGVLEQPSPQLEQGCCSFGAHFSDEEDRDRVRAAAARLDPALWQFAAKGARGVDTGRGRAGMTRIVEGACIFLNRPGFSGGAGCALHLAALARDASPLEWKPDVCWQLPLRRQDLVEESGHVTSVVSGWERRHWGEAGGEFAWWCTEEPAAFSGTQAVYLALRDELVALVGTGPYRLLAEHLDARAATAAASRAEASRAEKSRAKGSGAKASGGPASRPVVLQGVRRKKR